MDDGSERMERESLMSGSQATEMVPMSDGGMSLNQGLESGKKPITRSLTDDVHAVGGLQAINNKGATNNGLPQVSELREGEYPTMEDLIEEAKSKDAQRDRLGSDLELA